MPERAILAESTHNDFVQAPLLLLIITDNKGFQAEQRDFFFQFLKPHSPSPVTYLSLFLMSPSTCFA